MGESADVVTVALTGQLPFLLLVAAAFTWPISVVLLWLYTRAVRRSMRSISTGSGSPPGSSAPADMETSGDSISVDLRDLGEGLNAAAPLPLWRDLVQRPWLTASAYAIGGLAYSVVTTVALHAALGLELLPIRFMIFLWLFGWPVVLTANIVAASTRSAKSVLSVGYFAGYLLLSLLSALVAQDASLVQQSAVLWLITNGPPSVLLLAFLARRVRAVGPLVLTFMFLALAGSNVVIAFLGARDERIRTVIDFVDLFGLGAYTAMALMVATGFLLFGVLGSLMLMWLSRRYRAKSISDESVTIDTIWLLFAFVHSFTLVFEHPAWILASPLAFLAYRSTARPAIRWMTPDTEAGGAPPRLLVLRSFAIGQRSARLFESVEKHWRRTGSIHLIAGVDLARGTVEPHEFLAFLTGRLARRFITGADVLERRVAEMDNAPDRDLRFRVNDFFCYNDTWRMVLSRLLPESDAVIMDLRGFSRQNSGCLFELGELARAGALPHVVFLVDDRTDQRLLRDTLEAARPPGPRGMRRTTVGVVRSRSLGTDLHAVLRALAAATTVAEPART
jgi:hypothetical protein